MSPGSDAPGIFCWRWTLEVIALMILATSFRTSGVKTPEFPKLFGTAEAVPSREPSMRRLLIGVGRGRNKFGQAQDRGGPARFAVNFIDARPGEMAFVGGRFFDGEKEFHLNAIDKAVKRDLTRSAGMMQAKTMAAGRKNGGLQFEDKLVGQAGVVSKKARHAAHRGGQALIGVHAQAEVKGAGGHG